VILSRKNWAELWSQGIVRFVSRNSLGSSRLWESGCTLAQL
jgi:hypothetical protein